MVYKTYIEKFNSIISDSKINTGLNPISEVCYGRNKVVSRAMIYFDHNKVKHLIEDGIMVDMDKMRHILHITNSGSLDFTELHDCTPSVINDNYKIRATSFDLIFFLIPKPWDRGKGFDYSMNYINYGYYSPTPIDPQRLVSTDGSNWFQRMNGIPWEENGIFSNETLSKEYDKFAAGEESIIIGRQHFDVGNEDIRLDITETFNKFLKGEKENYGIGIAFTPMLELSESERENYISFMTDKTNTFFEPYVETRYTDVISDDRANFVLNKKNRLYLYCNIGDTLTDLDKNPLVTITNSDDEIVLKDIEATKQCRGVYYIELTLSKNDFEANTMLYDTWGGIVYQGTELDDVELDFVVKPTPNFFNLGNSLEATNTTFTPSVTGIKEKEAIRRGDVRKLIVKAKPNYTSNTIQLMDYLDIRLYIKDGTREIDVIEWDCVNKAFSENYYMVDTNMLIPQRYYIDIRIRYGMNSIIHHDVLSFDIVDDLNNKYA